MANPAATEGTIVAKLGADGVIRVTGKGFLSDETFRAYFKEIMGLLEKRRSENASIRMLVDTSDGTIQSATTIEGYGRVLSELRGPADRIAVLAKSSLSKMQSDRVGKGNANYRAFTSAAEAEAWLAER